MSNQTQDSSFKKLLSKEKISRFRLLFSQKKKVHYWQRGNQVKRELEILNYNEKESYFEVSQIQDGIDWQSKVFFNFKLGDVLYFASGNLLKTNDTTLLVTKSCDLYRLERRKNYRLKLYPQLEYYCYIKLEVENRNNIYDFKTQKNQNELFVQFLSQAGDELAQYEAQGYTAFRILDISTTGLSLRLGADSLVYFQKDQILSDMIIVIDSTIIKISQSQVEHFAFNKFQRNAEVFFSVAGLCFSQIDDQAQEVLDDFIIKNIKDTLQYEREFEEID